MGQGKSLKSERYNPWFKPRFNILLCNSIRSMFRVLAMYNFVIDVKAHEHLQKHFNSYSIESIEFVMKCGNPWRIRNWWGIENQGKHTAIIPDWTVKELNYLKKSLTGSQKLFLFRVPVWIPRMEGKTIKSLFF